ncbi:hypothetical protein V8E36_002154 [Tilletia maclaganii]
MSPSDAPDPHMDPAVVEQFDTYFKARKQGFAHDHALDHARKLIPVPSTASASSGVPITHPASSSSNSSAPTGTSAQAAQSTQATMPTTISISISNPISTAAAATKANCDDGSYNDTCYDDDASVCGTSDVDCDLGRFSRWTTPGAGLQNPLVTAGPSSSAAAQPNEQTETRHQLAAQRPTIPPARHDIQSMLRMFQQFSPSSREELTAAMRRVNELPATTDPIMGHGVSHTQHTSSSMIGQPNAELHRSKSIGDPHFLLGYNPTGQLEDVFPLPCQATLNKVAQSHFVDLWHFTKEGITAGNRLMDQLGIELVLPKVKLTDEQMPLELFNNAQAAHIRAIRHSARQQIVPGKSQLLYHEAEVWEKAYDLVIRKSQDHGWASMAVYMGMLRQQYYLRLPGEDRFNPGIWQPKIWESVLYVRQQNQLEGRLPYQAAQGMVGSLPSYGAIQPYGMLAAAPAFMGVPGPSYYQQPQAGPSRSSGSGPRSTKRGRGGGGGSKPFPSASQGQTRTFGGICIICGRSNEAFGHDFKGDQLRLSSATSKGTSSDPATIARSACLSTEAPANGQPTLAGLTSAPSAPPKHTELSSVQLLCELSPELVEVSRPLYPDGFERVLKELDLFDDYGGLVDGMRHGFDFGIPPLRETRTPPNHISARENIEALQVVAAKELAKGRWAGPYHKDKVERILGPFQCSIH